MTVGKAIKEKVTASNLFVAFATFIGLVTGLESLYEKHIQDPPILWAYSISIGLFVLWCLLNYCWIAQSVMQDEINRISEVKTRLEGQVIKSRQSSRKR